MVADKQDYFKHPSIGNDKESLVSVMNHLDLKGMALITIWWYKDASAAPMNGPTQKIHCNKNRNRHC